MIPAKFPQLGAVDSVTVVVERTVVGVLDPLVELFLSLVWNVEVLQEVGAEGNVGDLVVGADVVGLTEGSLVENRVECISSIAGEEVTTGRRSIPMENERLSAVQ